MTIAQIVRQGFHYARTCRSLWLFGLIVGFASGGSNGGGGGGSASGAAATAVWTPGGLSGFGLSVPQMTLIAIVIAAAFAAFVVIRLAAEAALIDGVVRARQGGRPTVAEGFRAGWAHWGVLVRITILYFAASIGSVVLLAAPCLLVLQALGTVAAVLAGIAAGVIAVPWLVTLYLVQAFAWRIAVLEDRQALDAIQKARLFLHGRLLHALKLLVAMFAGTLGIALVGAAVMVPVVMLLVALLPVLRVAPVIVLGCLVLLPVIYVFAGVLGTYRSSIWTIVYLTQVEL